MLSKEHNIGYYYHLYCTEVDGRINVPGEIGVFFDELSKSCNRLYLILHEANNTQKIECDYELKSKNVTWINLGKKKPAWHNFIFNSFILKGILEKLDNKISILVVRSPTALSPFFKDYISSNKLVYHIVGDYKEGARIYKTDTNRKLFIKYYLLLNDYLLGKAIKNSTVIVNSKLLFEKYKNNVKNLYEIGTSTLTDNDFYRRTNTCQTDNIKLLYTGRIDYSKGLFELIKAHSILTNQFKLELHIVGWEADASNKIKNELFHKAQKLGSYEYVKFHDKKKVGEELNAMYRNADIYIIASHYEGFPRTIWEAMANCTPVITTGVGGIPYVLKNKKDAIIIRPKNVEDIVESVKLLIRNEKLRKSLIANGYNLAKEKTIFKSTSLFVDTIFRKLIDF